MPKDRNRKSNTAPKPYAFVIMDFDKRYDIVYKSVIQPAAKTAGVTAHRLDDSGHYDEQMLEQIRNQISHADFCIAEVSAALPKDKKRKLMANPNVYYEIGYAHAINKLVIPMVDSTSKIPFDLVHKRHLIYDMANLEEAKQKLIKDIRWAVAQSKSPAPMLEPDFRIYISSATKENRIKGNHTHVANLEEHPNDEISLDFEFVFLHNPGLAGEDRVRDVYLLSPEPSIWQISVGNGQDPRHFLQELEQTVVGGTEIEVADEAFQNCVQTTLSGIAARLRSAAPYTRRIRFSTARWIIRDLDSTSDVLTTPFKFRAVFDNGLMHDIPFTIELRQIKAYFKASAGREVSALFNDAEQKRAETCK